MGLDGTYCSNSTGREVLVLSRCSDVDGQGEERGKISSFDLKFATLCVWGGDMEYGMAFAVCINQAVCDASV